jgi:hypothetical protein
VTDVVLIALLALAPLEAAKSFGILQVTSLVGIMFFYFIYPFIPWVLCDFFFWAGLLFGMLLFSPQQYA